MIDEYFISICLVHMVHYYLSASSSIENRFLKLDLIRSSQIGWKSFSQQLCHFLFSLWSQTAFIWTLSWDAIWNRSDEWDKKNLKFLRRRKKNSWSMRKVLCPVLSNSISENLNLGFPVFDAFPRSKGQDTYRFVQMFPKLEPLPIRQTDKYTDKVHRAP